MQPVREVEWIEPAVAAVRMSELLRTRRERLIQDPDYFAQHLR